MKGYLLIYLKGLAMGGADVVPGVSGGTIAFITRIYTTLIDSIHAINKKSVRLLVQGHFKEFWLAINGAFLLPLGLGILTSIVTLAQVMNHLLLEYPIQVWSFFFGLILASAPLILQDVERWNVSTVIALMVGAVLAYYITILTPSQTPDNWYFIILCGALAICAMILPGISGAFILLLLGKYSFMIEAIATVNLKIILLFSVGCVIGLLSFANLLNYILTHFKSITMALLVGFMLGSLNKVWPWKEITGYRIDEMGKQIPTIERSILPETYTINTGQDALLLFALLFGSMGILLVVMIEKTKSRKSPKT